MGRFSISLVPAENMEGKWGMSPFPTGQCRLPRTLTRNFMLGPGVGRVFVSST
jgi:hypothetical protein